MSELIFPANYRSDLDLHETQVAIKTVKDTFQGMLSARLNLLRVSAPLFVDPLSGMNDNLNGYERPVAFDILHDADHNAEIVQSLAKWKRHALQVYDFYVGKGLFTDMNAIRRDETCDNIHSIYVDQWDWEKVITREERTMETFCEAVRQVYKALRKTEQFLAIEYDYIETILPREITFISSQELLDLYPSHEPKEREYLFTKEHGAVCITQIGDVLSDGKPHDGRSPDYDDWSMNGDILVYYPLLDIALELSSMGVRVDASSLREQLKKAGCEDRAALPFQKAILQDALPFSIGGGIGQSRICMFFLRKAHIGEVQSSLWPLEMVRACQEHGIRLL
ncbi:MAG: aspartate--ammonia ligase [Lachnospiraceae bacterium]|nr:aspartate--ammonia ligase [Lachnospiraceae bacterium]